MNRYYVNKCVNSQGHHEVHRLGCVLQAKVESRIYLGVFPSGTMALVFARRLYGDSQYCVLCRNTDSSEPAT
ncbi:hypothetical protein AL475_20720 [Vibrio fluvialis]|nr:hypothetical protein AL475_20720 [Vibrio fluvialis]